MDRLARSSLRASLLLVCFLSNFSAASHLVEELTLLPTVDGHIFSSIKFSQSLSFADLHIGHFGTFPRSISRLLFSHNVTSFDLTLTRGIFDMDRWGVAADTHVAPIGAELSVVLGSASADRVDRWSAFVEQLAGLMCASLGQMDAQRTFWHSGHSADTASARLPRESVCTENLTPFAKLLPCRRGSGGLAELLNPHVLFGAPYEMLRIRAGRDDETNAVRLDQHVVAVLPRAPTLSALFGVSSERVASCARAEKTSVAVAGGDASDVLVDIPLGEITPPAQAPMAPVALSRFLTESGPGGRLILQVASRADYVQTVRIEQSLPSFLSLFAHSISVESSLPRALNDTVMSFVPSSRRPPADAPGLLSVQSSMAPGEVLTVSALVRKSWLHIEEHPPDANRGLEVPGMAVTALAEGRPLVKVYAAPVLVYVPLPDFSMPYNVITATSSVIAVFFGYVFNSLTRKYVANDKTKGNTLMARLLAKLKRRPGQGEVGVQGSGN